MLFLETGYLVGKDSLIVNKVEESNTDIVINRILWNMIL